MEGGTMAALAALVVALLALLVATAQVAQQYIGTASLVRKCDSSVFGPLPGRGRRVWFWPQMRFKVLYSIPQISLTPELWPEMYRSSCRDLQPSRKLPYSPDTDCSNTSDPSPGEASWVSFYRAVERSCRNNIQYELVEGDADRCPPDLPVIPMHIPLRDIIVMALMNGMVVTYANPNSSKVIAMQGPPGSISSSEHPLLGTIVHFSPQRVIGNYGVTLDGIISGSWMQRLVADCPVAGKDLSPFERDHIEQTEGRWMKRLIQKMQPSDDSWDLPNPFIPEGRHRRTQWNPFDAAAPAPYYTDTVANTEPINTLALTRVGKISWKIPSNEIVPWRRSWPRGLDEDKESSAVVSFNHLPGQTRPSEDCHGQMDSTPPEAPEVPGSLTGARGINDGYWTLSSGENQAVIFILPAPLAAINRRLTGGSWFQWFYDLMGTTKIQNLGEKNPFLPLIRDAVKTGWRMAEGHRLAPRFAPLPGSDDSCLLERSTEIDSDFPALPFPPDFLDSRAKGDLEHSLQNCARLYTAITKQHHRRLERSKEISDLRLVKYIPPNRPELLGAPQNTESNSPNAQSQALVRNTVGVIGSHVKASRRAQHRICDGPKPLMIQTGSPSTTQINADGPTSEAQHPRRNLAAYVESDDEHSILNFRDTARGSADESSSTWGTSGSGSGGSDSTKRSTRKYSLPSRPQPGNHRDRDVSSTSESDEDTHRRRVIDKSHPKRDNQPKSKRSRYIFKEASKLQYETSSSRYDSDDGWSYKAGSVASQTSEMRRKEGEARKQWLEDVEAEMEAENRQRMRDHERDMRDLTRKRRSKRPAALVRRVPDDVSWFWICQMDIIPGYWATPWAVQFNPYVCLGTIAVIIEALLGLTDEESLRYCHVHQLGTWAWLRDGKRTFPPYARNARGGVVVGGTHETTSFAVFEQDLPPIQLIHCYDYQVCRVPRVDDVSVLNRQLELMTIDSWLSLAGRTPEISQGQANLLRTAPALVSKLMQEFGYDFGGLDFTASEGGLQVIQTIVEELMDAMEDEDLSEPEQLFVLVALLRTAKVGLCISIGSSTEQVREYLATDIQVFLA